MTTPSDLIARLESLERSAVRWRRAALVMLVGSAAVGMMGFRAASSPRVVEAERLVLHDASGRPNTVHLAITPSGALGIAFAGRASGSSVGPIPEVILRDEAGAVVARLGGAVVRNAQP